MGSLYSWLDEWELALWEPVTEQSRITYVRGARQFLDHLAVHHPEVEEPSQITRRHVESWMRALVDTGKAEATRRIRLKSLRLWLRYMTREIDSGLTHNPADGVPLPVANSKPVPIIADEVLKALLATAAGADYIDRRDTAIIRLLLDCGMRRGELCALNLDDVDVRGQEALIRRGKGGKSRVVPFGTKTALALTRYMRARGRHQAAATTAALLLPTRPGTGHGQTWRFTGKGVGDMLERRCRAAGLAKVNPHAFRHTWAHDMMNNGANESDVERLAGWSSPLMVRRYGSSAADERARNASRRLARGDRV